MDGYIQRIAVALQAAALIGLATSIALVYLQMKRTQEWNRRKATQDVIFQMLSGEIAELRRKLQLSFGADPVAGGSYEAVRRQLTNEESRLDLEATTRTLLNYFEGVCIGMRSNVLDEQTCLDMIAVIFTTHWTWAAYYVEQVRAKHPTVYVELEHYAREWIPKYFDKLARLRGTEKRRL